MTSAGPARSRILDAALAGLAELTPADLVTAVGTREVARRAGVSTATLFYHFGNVEALAAAVVERVYHVQAIDTGPIVARLAATAASRLPLEEAFEMHGSEFDRLTNDPGYRVRVGLWALSAGTVDDVYGAFLRDTEAMVYEITEALFRGWGRELRPPFTMTGFHATQVALLTGTTLRHHVDPQPDDRDRFVRSAAALSMTAMRVRGERRTLDDRLTEMNYYPLVDARSGAVVSERGQQVRAVVLDAAARTFGTRGYDATTVAMVARAASVSTSTLYHHFDGKAQLAVAVLAKQAADQLRVRQEDPDAGPAELLERHLAGLARFAGARQPLLKPYVAQLATHDLAVDDPVVAATDELVGRVARADLLRPGLPLDLVTHLLVTTVLARVLGVPAESADEVAATAVSLVLA